MKAMKIIRSVMAALPLVIPILSLAKSENVNGVYWTYTVTNGKATIGDGRSPAIGQYTVSGAITVPSELGGYPVTRIGDCAFKQCSNLTKVTIPDTVTSIGSNAFYYCTSLWSVNIPAAVMNIGNWAFYHCESLQSVTIPDSVINIGDDTFGYCRSLTNVTFSSSVTNIGDWAFWDCDSLTSVTIPSAVKSIGKSAFSSCDSLKSVYITDLAAWCRISFGGSGANPLSCAHNLYLNGTLVKELTIPSSITSVKNYAFNGWGWEDSVVRPTSVTIPSSVKSIGDYAFRDCNGISNVMIPSSVTSIGSDAFYDCDYLKDVTISSSVTSIGSWAFANCTRLTSMTIPDSVTKIGTSSFFGCSGITNVTMKGDCPSIGASAFYNVAWGCKVWLPNGNATYAVTNGEWQGMTVRYYNGLYAVTFDANGGTGGSSMTLEYGTAIAAPTVTRDGYVFNGWSPNVAATVPASNVTYKAQWKARSYTVTFDANGGTGGTSTMMDCGANISPPNVTRIGYTFNGWEPTVASSVPASNMTYKAQWTANIYSIAYDPNGGTGTMNATDCTYDSEAIVAANEFMCSSHVFCGWATNATGAVAYMAGQPVTNLLAQAGGIVTLYAVWKSFVPIIAPNSGMLFDGTLAVSISCPVEGATIYYTTDGSDPTAESPVYRRFRITGKTTVKAVAEVDGMLSDVVVAHYALGQCADPVISLANGTVFEHSNQEVSIDWTETDGVLRYTLDGSDPTAESPTYDGPFTISESTVIKAKVFSDDLFDSMVVTSSLTRVRTNVATPVIDAAASFTGSKTKVTLSCATDGALVRYTLDGNEPNSHSTKYAGPFYVTESCTVKAYATLADYLDSAVATKAIEKVWNIGDTLGKPDHGFTTDGSGGIGWIKVCDSTAPQGEAMKSGSITHNQTSVLSTTVTGPGVLSFSWRTSCEDSGGQYDWDHVEFAVDGSVLLKRDGINSWTDESVRINGDGEHTVMWTYKKDDVESDGDDAAYVAGYGWMSDYSETKTTDVPVPYAWLLQHDPEIVDEFEAYETAAKAMAANRSNKVWECYVAGISPTNETSRFTAKIEVKDGAPIVTWEPDLNTNGIIRTYKVYGSETLEGGGDWQYPTNNLHRFFKVKVELP